MSLSGKLILVADRGDAVRTSIRAAYEHAGAIVMTAGSAERALELFHAHRADAVVLESWIATRDDTNIVERIRSVSTSPLLLLSDTIAKPEVAAAVRSGADGCLRKPVRLDRLIARTAALIERAHLGLVGGSGFFYDDDYLEIDLRSASVTTRGDRELALGQLELRVLTELVRHPGRILSAGQLLDLTWDDIATADSERIAVCVEELVKKIHLARLPRLVEVVDETGYRYRAEPPHLPW